VNKSTPKIVNLLPKATKSYSKSISLHVRYLSPTNY